VRREATSGHSDEELWGAAIHHATDRVPVAGPGDRIDELRSALIGREFEYAGDIVVLDQEELVGLMPLERLLAADATRTVAEVMDDNPPVVSPDTDQEKAAWKMVERQESGLAVVDERGRFRGLIPPYRMLEVLLAEHDEDLARLGGYLTGSTRARVAALEPVARRLRHRLPWLLVGLVGAMAASVIVGAFEDELEANVLLAFFVPALVYMAGAVGLQTEIVLIRAFAAEIKVRQVVRRELITGLVMGLVIGLVFYLFALVGWGDQQVAGAVALALFASCFIAIVVAVALPAGFQRLDKDPAFGSGPLATVIQDLVSIGVYFAVVSVVVT
jgi:magnesium transporter